MKKSITELRTRKNFLIQAFKKRAEVYTLTGGYDKALEDYKNLLSDRTNGVQLNIGFHSEILINYAWILSDGKGQDEEEEIIRKPLHILKMHAHSMKK